MPLNTFIDADPASLYALSDYLRGFSERAQASGDAVMASRSKSSPWQGVAADGYRAVGCEIGWNGYRLRNAMGSTADAVRVLADMLDAGQRRMMDARDVAAKGKLDLTDREILDPGPEPPQADPVWWVKVPREQAAQAVQEQRGIAAAHEDWLNKVAVYAQCAAMVGEGRTIEQDAYSTLVDAVSPITDKPIIFGSNFVATMSGGFIEKQQNLRTTAKSFRDIAAEARVTAGDPAHGAPTQAANSTQALLAEAKARALTDKANTKSIGSFMEKLPRPAQRALTFKLEKAFPKEAPFLSKAPAVFKNITGVGTAFTGASIIADGVRGKSVARSAFTNGSGLLAGTGVGGLLGGPPGALAGFVVGTGTSLGLDAGIQHSIDQAYDPRNWRPIAPGGNMAHLPGMDGGGSR